VTIQKFFTSRVKQTTGSTYVGEKGRMFYDETTKSIRVSDGVTAGGQPILFTTLSANIGNLYVTGGNISNINANQDINLVTNGTGNVKVIGEFFVTQTDGTPLIDSLTNGTLNFYVPVQNATDSGIDIIGTPNQAVVTPQNVGVMLHITGQPTLPSRVYNDGANAYAFYGGRRYNGTASSPSAISSNTLITRYGSTPYASSGWPTVSTARIEMYATEAQTSTNQGSNIALWTTPIGTSTITQVASIDDQAVTVTGNIRYDQTQNNATVTQQTNKTTAVTCNGRTGQITTTNGIINKGVAVKFTVNNTYITSAKDVVIVNIASGATVPYSVSVNNISAAGSFDIAINNADSTGSGANASDTLVINFAIIRVN
jgi:hypothetical protein